ncbi:MAG: beta-glucanase, partial [Spirochaetes bacterium]
MEAHVQQYWDYWSGKYLKQSTVETTWYYVLGESNGDTPSSWGGTDAKATSEGHGYGMIITALMDKQTEFDGLYNMYKAFPSTINKNLMSWIIPENEDTNLRSDSASDGDIDIAYALLLADAKWGLTGTINYKGEAVRIINSIMESEISHTTWRVLLGDWDSDDYSTRPSDWIPDHFRAFKEATG